MVHRKSSTVVLLAACALMVTASFVTANSIKTAYSPAVDFTQYQTFMWIKEPDCVNPYVKQAIIDGINTQLESKGLYLAEDNADLAVSANIATGERNTLREFYEGFCPEWHWQHYLGPGSSTKFIDMYKERANTYKVGTLVVDLFETNHKHVVWWGVADKFVYEYASEGLKQMMEVFEKMFSGTEWWTTMP